MRDDRTYQFEARLVGPSTSKAVLVAPTVGPDEVWVPRSQILHQERNSEETYTFIVTEWWATRSDQKEWTGL